jgi:hypothetical protein
MPAYYVKYPNCTCGRKSECEVFNTYNATMGYYCLDCGKRKVREMHEIAAREAEGREHKDE